MNNNLSATICFFYAFGSKEEEKEEVGDFAPFAPDGGRARLFSSTPSATFQVFRRYRLRSSFFLKKKCIVQGP